MAFFMSSWEKYLYSILRIVAGFLFLWHGSMKLFGYPPLSGGSTMPMTIVVIGGIIEFFGGIFIMFGLFTHVTAFIASGEMAVAYWMAHFPVAFLPIQNYGEMALLNCFLFFYIAARGSGVWALDNLIFKTPRETAGDLS